MTKAKTSIPSVLIAAAVAILSVMILITGAAKAYADPAPGATVQHSGAVGTCTWEVYSDGTLVIRPTNGVEGGFTGAFTDDTNVYPWCTDSTSFRSDITRVEVQGIVHAKGKLQGLFYHLENATYFDLSGLETSEATSMLYMFHSCSGVTSLDVSGFDTGNVTTMKGMFQNCSSLTSLDVSGFNMSNTTDIFNMFASCSGLTSLNLGDPDTSNVTNMTGLFSSCSSLTSLNVSVLETSNVTSMQSMFNGCSSLTSLDVSGFDTRNATGMTFMFQDCSSLTSLNVSGFDTSKVSWLGFMNMFSGCSSLTSLDVSGFDVSGATNMRQMFADCNSLTSLNLGEFNTSSATNMAELFKNCSSLTSIDMGSTVTARATNMSNMFSGCTSLTTLNIGAFDTGRVTNMTGIFDSCSNLSKITLSPDFQFKSQAVLPTPPSETTTGKWIKEDETAGPLTAEDLRDQYAANAGEWAGVWVWEEIPTKYTLFFVAPANASGSMTKQKIVAAEDGTIKPNEFFLFNHHFDHWDASDGNTYADGATIVANTYVVGDEITLTAVFVENDNSVNMENGTFDLILHGGEKATFSGIPAGTAYQVWEETPDGWVLVEQTNTSGSIQPLETASTYFLNKYQPGTATATIVGSKIIDGHAAPAGAYTFELLENGDVIQTKTNTDGGFIAFDTITYTTIGDHTYTVREVPGGDSTIEYDSHEETITVSVTDNDGTLSTAITYDDDGVGFVNHTKPGVIEIIKNVTGQTDANKDTVFTFQVILQSEDGTMMAGSDYSWHTENISG